MKEFAQKILNGVGYEIRRLQTPYAAGFVPFVRGFDFFDEPFKMWITNPEADAWYEKGAVANSGELKMLRAMTQAGDRVLEIGSHHGFTAMLLAGQVGPGGAIVSLEANPRNAVVAQAQLGLNRKFSNLEFLNLAGAKTRGKAKITAANNSQVSDRDEGNLIEVETERGDQIDEEKGPFNFLKVDVEGFELDVLQGCAGLLARAPKIAIEVHLDALRARGQNASDILGAIGIDRYEGEMVVRADDPGAVLPFSPDKLPDHGEINLFLRPKK